MTVDGAEHPAREERGCGAEEPQPGLRQDTAPSTDLDVVPFLCRMSTERPTEEQADDILALVNEVNRVRSERDRERNSANHAAASAMDWRDDAKEAKRALGRVKKLVADRDPARSYKGPFGGWLFHENDILAMIEGEQ